MVQPATTKRVKTTLYLPADVHYQLKIEAAQRRMTMTDILVEALERRAFFLRSAPEPKP